MSGSVRAMPRVRRARQPRRRSRLWVPVLALVVLLVIATPGLVNLLVTYWWFGELGYGSVYTTELVAKQYQLIRDTLPQVDSVALIVNPDNAVAEIESAG